MPRKLMGHEGFVGTSSLLYHIHPPTTVKTARRVKEVVWAEDDDTSLRHRHFLTGRVKQHGSPTLDRIPLLFNSDIGMLYVEPDENDVHFYRNSQADECVYVVEGTGVLETVFGDLPFKQGDYVVIHRNITHRWRFDLASPAKLLVFESRGHVRFPSRYKNNFGQLLEGAPFSERDIRRPTELRPRDEMGDFPILVKQYNAINEAGAGSSPAGRGGLGRVLLPLDLQHPRLRAHRRPDPPAAAGAPDLPGRRLRHLQLLPAAVRLRPECGPGALQPQQRGLG